MKRLVVRVTEAAIIGLGLASFWPLTFGYDDLWYQAGALAVLLLLVMLLVVRVRRVRRVFSEARGCDLVQAIPRDSVHGRE